MSCPSHRWGRPAVIERLEIAEKVDGTAHVVSVRGEVDIATAPTLGQILGAVLESHEQVVLDLSGVSFIDSTGIGVLMAAARMADADGGGFAIRDPSQSVLRVLELSGVSERLKFDQRA
jgi:anti-sigma B factor antagonist